MIELSIVIPTYRSENFLKETLNSIHQSLSEVTFRFEYIIVNDGIDENVNEIVIDFQKDVTHAHLINLENNYGQQVATQVGIEFSKGKYIVTTDDDLQYSPEDILKLYNKIIEDDTCSIVCGFSRVKVDKTFLYKFIRMLFLFISNYLYFPRYRKTNFFTPFKIYRRSLFFDRENFNNKNIYFFWGFDPHSIKSIEVKLRCRLASNSGYGLVKLLKFMRHIIIKMLLKTFIAFLLLSILIYSMNLISTRDFLIVINVMIVSCVCLSVFLRKLIILRYKIKEVIHGND